MKTETEILEVKNNILRRPKTDYEDIVYLRGVRDALLWVLEEISDKEADDRIPD